MISINEIIKDMKETLEKLNLNIKQQKKDIIKIIEKQKKEDEEKQSLNCWIEKYKKLTIIKMKNKINLMKMNQYNKNISNELSYIDGIIKEIHKKENNDLNINMLEDFLLM